MNRQRRGTDGGNEDAAKRTSNCKDNDNLPYCLVKEVKKGSQSTCDMAFTSANGPSLTYKRTAKEEGTDGGNEDVAKRTSNVSSTGDRGHQTTMYMV